MMRPSLYLWGSVCLASLSLGCQGDRKAQPAARSRSATPTSAAMNPAADPGAGPGDRSWRGMGPGWRGMGPGWRGMGPGWRGMGPGWRGMGPGWRGMGPGWRGMGPGWRGRGPGPGWRGPGPGWRVRDSAIPWPVPSHGTTPAEKKILAVLKRLNDQRTGMSSVPRRDGRLLRVLVELVRAKKVVELGTSSGYSALWMALGLLRTGGKLTTFEIDPQKIEIAKKAFAEADVAGRITLVAGDAHKKLQSVKGPLDLVFIDADKQGYPDYLKQLLPKVRVGGLIVAHNMVRPRPSKAYIKAITENPALETLFLHMSGPGIAVTLKKAPAR